MGHTQVVALLLQAGASPNLPDRKASTKSGFKGLSPLQWSLKYRRTDIVKLLLATGAIDFTYRTTRKGRNFWHYAARYVKDRDLLTILPPIGLLDSDYFGITPLQHAQAHKNTTFISLFQSSPRAEETRSACIISWLESRKTQKNAQNILIEASTSRIEINTLISKLFPYIYPIEINNHTDSLIAHI